MLIKEKIKRNFSKSAFGYDQYAEMHRRISLQLLYEIPEGNYKKILDVGCGTGFFSSAMAGFARDSGVLAVDLAPGMIKYARAMNSHFNLQFMEGDGENLPFPDNTFDLAVSSLSFQWMNPDLCFSEVKRVLCTDGKLYFSLFGPGTLIELKQLIGDRTIHSYPEAQQLKNYLEGINFREVEIKTISERRNFSDFFSLARFLKGLGAQTGKDVYGLRFKELAEKYREKYSNEDGIFASFEVILGWGKK